MPEKEVPSKPKTPPKPVMSVETVAYPKRFKIYKELSRQNGIIFEAEKERNVWELERDSLKGLSTSRGEQNCLKFLKELKPNILISSGRALVRTLRYPIQT